MDLNELRAVSRPVLSDELKEQQQPDCKEQSKSEPNSKKQQDEDGITLGKSSPESPTYVFLKTHDTKWSVMNGTSIPRRTLPGLGIVVMLKDIWSEDAVQRPIASEERTRAVEADTVPTINALASPVAEKPSGTLLGRVNDSRILLAEEREVADFIASGECRLFEATEGYSGTRSNDTSWRIQSS